MAEDKTMKEEMVTIKIPVDPQNPSDNEVPVGINGQFWKITRGVRVEVPQRVADVLEASNYI